MHFVVVDLAIVHPRPVQSGDQCYLEVDEHIFHLLACLYVSASVGLAKAFEVVVIVATHNDWAQGQGVEQVIGRLFGQGRRIARISFLLDAPDEVCGVFKGSDNFSRVSRVRFRQM